MQSEAASIARVTQAPPGREAGMGGRVHALDSLRAVAMFLGIVLHGALSFTALLPVPWAARDVGAHWVFDLTVGLIHGFRMQLFFFLAGYFARLLYARLGPNGFLKHRLKRIGLPFVVGMIVLVPMTLVLWVWGFSKNPAGLPSGSVGLPTVHLWFLEYLLLIYAVVLVGAPLASRVPGGLVLVLDRIFDAVLRSPLRVLPFLPLTVVALWNGPIWGEVHNAGEDITPRLSVVGYYGLFFLAGWWLHRRHDLLGELPRFMKTNFFLAFAAMTAHGIIFASEPAPEDANYLRLKVASLSCAAFYAWAMTFAVTGWFLRFASKPRDWVRYLADASYWCYLVHLPVVLGLQIIIARWPISGFIKFPLLLAVTMALLLVSYHWRVRYTYIGAVLNGPRMRKGE
jgi:peptidoglycan/LPS O-acetylase OafA/YrhL